MKIKSILIALFIYFLLATLKNYGNVYAYTYCGLGETYDYLTDSCKCSYGYVRTYSGCITEDQYCKNLYGYGAKATFGGKCECRSGYIMSGGRCESGVTYCSRVYGIHAQYDYLSESCECRIGYIMSGKRCLSYDEKCQEEYGNGAEAASNIYSKYDTVECRCKNDYLWNSAKTQCIDADLRCKEILGFNSKYNSISMECECDYGYLIDPIQKICISENEYCESQIGENSNYIGDGECECNSGYVLDDNSGECMEEELYCETYFGPFMEYSGNGECECMGGYHMGDYECEKDIIPLPVNNSIFNKILLVLSIGGLIYLVLKVLLGR